MDGWPVVCVLKLNPHVHETVIYGKGEGKDIPVTGRGGP
jgi:hypothetical protein